MSEKKQQSQQQPKEKHNSTRIYIKVMERTKCAQKLMLIACDGYEKESVCEWYALNFSAK